MHVMWSFIIKFSCFNLISWCSDINMANRTTLNKEQKIALITYKNTNPSTSNVDLSKWIKQSYNLVVHPSIIGHILKRKIDDIVGNGSAKRQRTVWYPELENALLVWILQSQNKIILTDSICSEKAKVFAQMLNIPLTDLHEQYYWLSSHLNMIGYSLYSLNARPLSARQKPGPVSLHLGRSHCISKLNCEFCERIWLG